MAAGNSPLRINRGDPHYQKAIIQRDLKPANVEITPKACL